MPNLGTMHLLVLVLSFSALVVSEKSKCKVCRDLTDHFKEYFEKTEGHNFGGGNTAWEEKSLGTYAKSETRLVEILEKSAKKCDYKCGSLLEDQEEYLEEWFFNRQDTDIFEELCVNELKRCCLKNRWGPDCLECPGGVETPCSDHGTCKGEGDRVTKDDKKAGTCSCDRGYNGTICDSCKSKYIAVGSECEECSTLCKGQCTAPGPTGCVECKKGYEVQDPSLGCADINECEGDGCGDPLEECVNSPGSYECICKSGYTRVAGKCQLEDLYAEEGESDEEAKKEENVEEAKEGDEEEYTEVNEDEKEEIEDILERNEDAQDSIDSSSEPKIVDSSEPKDEL